MNSLLKKTDESIAYLKSKNAFQADYGIVLGSGLKNLVKEIEIECEIPFEQIPHFPRITVEGHGGNLIMGYLSGKKVAAMSGRFHYYEGYSMEEVSYPIRMMKRWGIDKLFVSNASGGVNPNMEVGDIMLITDHINMQPENPLRGKNDPVWGPRFPDMLGTYDAEWIRLAEVICKEQGIHYHKGVYVGVSGPNFETPAEYKFFHLIGGDAVGMSTVPEVIVARHMGMRVFAISVISDVGYPAEKMEAINHQMVLEMAAAAEPKMTSIIKELLKRD